MLHISASPMGELSASRKVADRFLSEFRTWTPHIDIKERDLALHPPGHLDEGTMMAAYLDEKQRTPDQQAKHLERLIFVDEILNADYITVSTSMWNWGVPSTLKAYIDSIILPGILDAHTKKLRDKKVTIIIACGGSYVSGSGKEAEDHATPYLKQTFEDLGATDISVIRSEYNYAGVMPGFEAMKPKKEESLLDALGAVAKRAVRITKQEVRRSISSRKSFGSDGEMRSRNSSFASTANSPIRESVTLTTTQVPNF
jgi:FMN-dependent NADH-azoreductase